MERISAFIFANIRSDFLYHMILNVSYNIIQTISGTELPVKNVRNSVLQEHILKQ